METLEQIDLYLDRTLPSEQAVGLEQNLRQDADIQHLFDRVVVARSVVRSAALRSQVKNLHVQLLDEMNRPDEVATEKQLTPVRPLWYRYGQSVRWGARVAASGLLLLAGYASYQYANTSIDTFYSAKFINYQLPATRGGNSSALSTLDDLYRTGAYTAITQRYGTLATKTSHDLFLTGMAYLHQHQYKQAITQFTRLQRVNAKQSARLFEQETEYYLALAYLGDGRIGDAYPLFEKIRTAPRHMYHQNVTESDLWELSLLRWKNH